MIVRILAIPTLLIILLLTGLIALIHTQSYDDSGLHNLLVPACGAPCFLGIYPGVTSGDEAFDLLNTHAWVTNVEFLHVSSGAGDDMQNGTISWSWAGGQPTILRTPYLMAGEAAILNGVVDSIRVRTAIPYGAIWLAMGQPETGWIRPSPVYLQKDDQVAVYPAHGLEIRTLIEYPLHVDDFWNAPADIYFEMHPPVNARYSPPCWWTCKR